MSHSNRTRLSRKRDADTGITAKICCIFLPDAAGAPSCLGSPCLWLLGLCGQAAGAVGMAASLVAPGGRQPPPCSPNPGPADGAFGRSQGCTDDLHPSSCLPGPRTLQQAGLHFPAVPSSTTQLHHFLTQKMELTLLGVSRRKFSPSWKPLAQPSHGTAGTVSSTVPQGSPLAMRDRLVAPVATVPAHGLMELRWVLCIMQTGSS